MAIILNFNPIVFFGRKKEMPATVEGRWILTDYKWVHTDRVRSFTDGGYLSFSSSDSEYYLHFSKGYQCYLNAPVSAVFMDSPKQGGKYSVNVHKNEIIIKVDKQTVKFSLLCLTNDTMQLYWTDGGKNFTIEEFFIFTRDKSPSVEY